MLFSILCSLTFSTAFAAAYWALLYKTSSLSTMAIISIIYFVILILRHSISLVFKLGAIWCTGFIYRKTRGHSNPSNTDEDNGEKELNLGAVVNTTMGHATKSLLFSSIITALFLGLSIWGLLLSINLRNSGSEQCPTNGLSCLLIVAVFTLSVLSLFFATKSSKSEQTLQTNENLMKPFLEVSTKENTNAPSLEVNYPPNGTPIATVTVERDPGFMNDMVRVRTFVSSSSSMSTINGVQAMQITFDGDEDPSSPSSTACAFWDSFIVTFARNSSTEATIYIERKSDGKVEARVEIN